MCAWCTQQCFQKVCQVLFNTHGFHFHVLCSTISALNLDIKRELKPFEISQKKKKLANWVSEWVRVTVTRELKFLIWYPFREFVHLMATKSLSSLLSISSSSSLRSLGINATTFHYVFLHLPTLYFFLTEDYWMFHLSCFELNLLIYSVFNCRRPCIQISNKFCLYLNIVLIYCCELLRFQWSYNFHC